MIITIIRTVSERSYIAGLYEEYGDELYFTALKILEDKQSAEDALHNAFVKIMKYPGKIKKLDESQRLKYLDVVCRNTAYNVYKARKKIRQHELDIWELEDMEGDSLSEPETAFFHQFSINEVSGIIGKLDIIYHDVIFASVVNDFDNKKIAKILGISEETVRKRLYRAKKKLEEILRKEYDIHEE